MSESRTGASGAPEPTEPAAPVAPYVPQHVLSSEDDDGAAGQEATPAPAAEPPEPVSETPPKVEKTPEEVRQAEEERRYRRQYARASAEKARADAAVAAARALEERIARLENPNRQAQGPDVEALAEQIAERKLAERDYQARFAKWDETGVAAYGQQPFREGCEAVGKMAPNEQQQQALVAIALDLEDDGPRAIMALAQDPERAEAILAMPAYKMALAITKLLGASPASDATPPAAARPSLLPPPIRPVATGRARGEPDPNGSMDDYFRYSAGVNWSNR